MSFREQRWYSFRFIWVQSGVGLTLSDATLTEKIVDATVKSDIRKPRNFDHVF